MNTFEEYLQQTKEYGEIEEVRHPLVYLQGLPNARLSEKIVFESGDIGIVISIEGSTVEAASLSKFPAKVGTRVVRTNESFSFGVGEHLFGKIVDPTGQILHSDQKQKKEKIELRDIDGKRALITERKRITRQLLTGISLIDLLLPLGMGQRELVVGDRKIGKTSVVLSLVKTQAKFGTVIVYALIGKERYEISKLYDFLKKEDILDQSVVVASTASDAASLINITPYTAMTIAEHFKDQGKNVLIVLDDLTTHAKFYREMSLLGKKFPGRDSYPGDVFFKHARLLERAGNFIHATAGEAAISCIPVAETVEDNLTDYITSNLIGITDGHLSFDQESFARGHRPAIDLFLSVTRVGRQTQTPFNRELSQKLLSILSSYRQALNFAHFGAELSQETKILLQKGELIYTFLEQKTAEIVPLPVQVMLIGAVMSEHFQAQDLKSLISCKSHIVEEYAQSPAVQKLIDELANQPDFQQFIAQIKSKQQQILDLCKEKT